MKLPTAGNFKGISRISFLHTHCNIGFDFLEQAVTQIAGSNVLSFFSGKRAVVYHEHHGNGRLVYLDERQWFDAIR